jgi:ferredoxin-NADP reductase
MARDHGFHPVRIVRVIEETPDARTFVLSPAGGRPEIDYRAGQFLTFRFDEQLRSYSMSSSPEVDDELCVTVKRVPGGVVSNRMHDELRAGDAVEVTGPSGVFCLGPGADREDRNDDAPLLAYAGGSGITPVFSLVKTALATTGREVRLLTADRDRRSVIFRTALEELADRYPDRLRLAVHLDDRRGLVAAAEIESLIDGADAVRAEHYVCGPAPFMDLVEQTLRSAGVPEDRLHIERFTPTAEAAEAAAEPAPATTAPAPGGSVTIHLGAQRATIPQQPGETLLQLARRAGLSPPFSCEAGDCATCMARVVDGQAKMRANNALDEDEVADGYVLTCQGEPVTEELTVIYED